MRFRQHGEGRPALRGVGPFAKSLDEFVSLVDPVEHLGVAFVRDLHTHGITNLRATETSLGRS